MNQILAQKIIREFFRGSVSVHALEPGEWYFIDLICKGEGRYIPIHFIGLEINLTTWKVRLKFLLRYNKKYDYNIFDSPPFVGVARIPKSMLR